MIAFQSTLPYGSDATELLTPPESVISIHAPLRERLLQSVARDDSMDISIHAPLRERLGAARVVYINYGISIHAPLRERPCRL